MGKWGFVLVFCCVLFTGCAVREDEPEKVRDLEYTVVCEDRLPEELLTEIKEKKAQPFELKYSDGNFMYLARGYGEKPTGGYSIRVLELYLTPDDIVFETEIIGPEAGRTVPSVISTPYVVVKTELVQNSLEPIQDTEEQK